MYGPWQVIREAYEGLRVLAPLILPLFPVESAAFPKQSHDQGHTLMKNRQVRPEQDASRVTRTPVLRMTPFLCMVPAWLGLTLLDPAIDL